MENDTTEKIKTGIEPYKYNQQKVQLCWQSIKEPHEIIFIEEREIKHISDDQRYDDMETFLNDVWESVNGTAPEGYRLLIVWPAEEATNITYTVTIGL